MVVSAEFLVNSVCSFLILAIVAYFYWPRSKNNAPGGTQNKCSDGPSASPAPVSSPANATPPLPGRKPESASPGAAAARAALTKASMAPPSKETYQGRVKRYSDRNGMGFISCRALHEKYSADVRVYRAEYDEAGLKVGDGVEFRTILGGRPNCPQGKPWATELKKLDCLPSDHDSSSEEQELRRRHHSSKSGSGEPQQKPSPKGPLPDRGLKADAPEFVPGSLLAAQSGSHTFNAAAAEFVPSGFRADAAEFVPSGFGAAAEEPPTYFRGYDEEDGEDFD